MASKSTSASHRRFSTVTGYFLQDDEGIDARTFNYTLQNFGLKHISNDHGDGKAQWQMFEEKVKLLNANSGPSTQYKLLFLARHGQGVHNVAEAFYGTPLWNCKWAAEEGNGTAYWVDAHLTDTGIEQARTAGRFWAKQILEEKMSPPESYYTSPLDRCCATAHHTFSALNLPPDRPFIPTVKELLRETNGVHTCDRRSSKTYLRTHYPTYNIEPGFTENDELWDPNFRESNSALDARLKKLLDDIFEHDSHTFISFTSHSGAISGILRVVGHREFRLVTGSVIPVLVKADVVAGEEEGREVEPGTPAVDCEV
ncbi:hypothetical protein MMC30_007298 [Trapelia coarctata]|nr:hypothetical protein [Trapelia coarctata]